MRIVTFLLAALVAISISTTASAGVGIGVTDGDMVELRAELGGFGLGILASGTAGQSEGNVDFTEVDLGVKLLLPLGRPVVGEGGEVQPLFWTTFVGDFTRYEEDEDNPLNLDSVFDKTGEFMIGAEWRPSDNFGLTSGIGVEWFIADEDTDNDMFGTAASWSAIVYF